MRKLSKLFILLFFCSACGNEIETGDSLKKQDFDRLYSLNLLDTNERLSAFVGMLPKKAHRGWVA